MTCHFDRSDVINVLCSIAKYGRNIEGYVLVLKIDVMLRRKLYVIFKKLGARLYFLREELKKF